MTTARGLTSADQGAGLSHPRPEILALTGLRGLAAVAVVLHQIGAPRSAPATLHHLMAAGGLGVPLFCLLSGFVLAYNYPSLSLRSGRRALGRYTMARVARIAPLTLAIGAAVLVLGAVNGSDWIHAVFSDPAWFIAVAIFLYAVFPVLVPVVAAASRRGVRGPLAVLVVAFCAQLVVLAVRLGAGSDTLLYRNPVVWIPDLVIGMALAFLVTGGLRVSSRTAYLVQAAAALYAVAITTATAAQGFGTAVQYSAVWAIPLGLVLLTLAAAPTSKTAQMLASRAAVHLGVIGLAAFLIQRILLHGLGPVTSSRPSNALLACCWIGLVLLLAEGAHRYIGQPGRRWVIALARQLDRRTGSAVPAEDRRTGSSVLAES